MKVHKYTSFFHFKKHVFQGRLKVSYYSCHMSPECFLINQVQITIHSQKGWWKPTTLHRKWWRRKRYGFWTNVMRWWQHFWYFQRWKLALDTTHFIHKYVNICFISCVLKILSFKDCLVYQNSFLQIPKSQPGYVSYMFLFLFLHFEPYVS